MEQDEFNSLKFHKWRYNYIRSSLNLLLKTELDESIRSAMDTIQLEGPSKPELKLFVEKVKAHYAETTESTLDPFRQLLMR